METSEKRLNKIMSQIQMIYLDSQNSPKDKNMEKKIENYNKSSLLIGEASNLIDSLQKEISTMDTTNASRPEIERANQLVDMLTNSNPRFDEILHIVQQLRSISEGIPNSAKIIDNINNEIIHIEEEIEIKN